jgi:hypothetical protein
VQRPVHPSLNRFATIPSSLCVSPDAASAKPTLPTENSVQPMGDVIAPTGPQSSRSLRLCPSLANEIRDVRVCKGAEFEHRFQWPKERKRVEWWNRALSGSPSLRHRR